MNQKNFIQQKTTGVLVASLLVAGLGLGGMAYPALAEPSSHQTASSTASPSNVSVQERELDQKISDQEPIAKDRVVIAEGHVDMGPKFVDGKWQLMIHDDHGQEPVWRTFANTVLQSKDSAKMPVPDDPRYSFVQAKPGEEVFVIPQTEAAGVVWPGWNTQDPEVVSRLGDGMNLTLESVEGPGQMTLYLENGNFSAPALLWDSTKKEQQKIWVDPNTHTHANWVFTAPGTYTATVSASAKLADGSEVKDTQQIRFAVGDSTDAQALLDRPTEAGDGQAQQDGTGQDGADQEAAPAESASNERSQTGTQSLPMWLVLGGGGLAALLLLGVFVFFALRSKKAQQAAEDQLK